VHRDIKPANVMIDREGMLRILDFGIARVEGSGLTQDGALIGSLNYMSPEQMLGRPIDHRSDIFSVGSVAYELISYQQAFKGNINDGLLHRLPHEDPPSLGGIVPGLPPGLEDVIMRALQKLPENRFQDLAEMRSAVVAVHGGTVSADDRTVVIRPNIPQSIGTVPPGTVRTGTAKTTTTELDSKWDFDNVKEHFPDFTISAAAPPEEEVGPLVVEPIVEPPTVDPVAPAAPVPVTTPPPPTEAPQTWSVKPRTPTPPTVTPATVTGSRRDATVTKRPPTGTVRPPTGTSRPATGTDAQPAASGSRRWMLIGAAVLAVAGGAVIALPYLSGPPPDPLEVELPAIQAAMERFRVGYRNRDMNAVLAAFPQLPRDLRQTMGRTFDNCIIYEVTFDQMNVALAPADATVAEADVRSTHTCTPQSGGRETKVTQHELYTLRKNGEQWVLNGVTRAPE
jgi:serine/threonine-protein kinase